MSNNSEQCMLSYGTPLLNDSTFHHDLGTIVDTIESTAIIQGTYKCLSNTDDTTISLLQLLQQHYNLSHPQIDNSITSRDYINYWKGIREATISSLSGLYFGHYKAAASSPLPVTIHSNENYQSNVGVLAYP